MKQKMTHRKFCKSADDAIAELKRLYAEQMSLMEARFAAFANDDFDSIGATHPVYPMISLKVPSEFSSETSNLSLGQLAEDNIYTTTITRPNLFESYFFEQLEKIQGLYEAELSVGLSDVPIPLPFALESATTSLTEEQKIRLRSYFYMPNLADTSDDIVDGKSILQRGSPLPLSLFTAERVDYSLSRMSHYTATNPEYFQSYILFTNYQRYVDEFIAHAQEAVSKGEAEALVEPGNRITKQDGVPSKDILVKMPQMPAYHLIREGGSGVTLINIGVGPSNAKTITDHLAVLRPHVWLMVGHCGALRRTQRLGDYVLAHAYLRDDNVLDHVLSPAIPLPSLAEVQLALTKAVEIETGLRGQKLKQHLRTGTVVTTDDRNWELRFNELAVHLNQSRAIAIDMESATLAANGYRYRVPYGTLLCASDRPLHGEIKLPGMANAFYQKRVSQHLKIGLKALELLKQEAEAGSLHSRKLRSFDEPLMR